jgi:hypothetical protein
VIEVAKDGETAKGLWIMTGLESGLTDPDVAANVPEYENWISFAARDAEAFDKDLMYFGEDGKPRFMPTPDEPATRLAQRYRPDESQVLEPRPPAPYRTFDETFEY